LSVSGTSGSAAVEFLAASGLALLLLGLALVFTPRALPAPVVRLIDRRSDVLVSAVGLVFLGVGIDLLVLALS
jgi:hypothetical protein